ncbi:MAG: tryptophan 2,3-dioxygenase family protein [Nitriliruptor sp.]|uniref:tryptophan 2,3-dioxygenase family protein n=1 Tax=Nitriliruptor sp. TaxID=2448056 RepID=UPI00349FFD84
MNAQEPHGADPTYYRTYLGLDEVLGAIRPVSRMADGKPAHDEHLFIVTHQAFELWFAQLLHDLDAVLADLDRDPVPDTAMGQVVHRLERMVTILPVLLQQFAVLETMTPLDFLDFRDDLVPASGFQSAQFRLLENRLGLDAGRRLKIQGAVYTSRLDATDAATVADSEEGRSLRVIVDDWLARTPFVRLDGFDLWGAYTAAVRTMLERDRQLIASNPSVDEVVRDQQLASFEQTEGSFATLLDRDRWEELRAEGKRAFTYEAIRAALLIQLYRDQPALHLPFRLLTALIDLDTGMTSFRQAHARMVRRAIGARVGTGGTSGHAYLEATTAKHTVFGDLSDLATFHLPRRELPELPPHVREQMGFRYDVAGGGGGARPSTS